MRNREKINLTAASLALSPLRIEVSARDRSGLPIAVIFRVDDARRFLDEQPKVSSVLALTPIARAEFVSGRHVPLLDPWHFNNDSRQARTEVIVARAREQLKKTLSTMALAASAHEGVIDIFNRVAYSACRLWWSLGASGPWLIPQSNGPWLITSAKWDAYRALVKELVVAKTDSDVAVARLTPPPMRGLYRIMRDAALRIARQFGPIILSGALKDQFSLFEHLANHHVRSTIVVAEMPRAGVLEYARLIRNFVRLLIGHRQLVVAITPTQTDDGATFANHIVDTVEDPIIGPAFVHCAPLIRERLNQILGGRADAESLVRLSDPVCYTAAEVSRVSDWLIADACGRIGKPRIVMSRNAHSPASSRLAEQSTIGYFEARSPSALVDIFLVWSPPAEQAARQVLPNARWNNVKGFRAIPSDAIRLPGPKERLILVADSYASWWFPHGWIMQTSDEFLVAMQSLIEAVAGLPNTRVLIRAKAKQEAPIAVLKKLLPVSDNCECKVRDGPFAQDLCRASVLVSFHSTTILEALHQRIPVLLLGGTQRYRYLAARTKPPTHDDRSAVYTVDQHGNLRAMLIAILASHVDRPLRDAEIGPYVYLTPKPSVSDIADAMISGDPELLWHNKGTV